MRRRWQIRTINPRWPLAHLVTCFFFLAISLYLLARAYLLSITHDEALTVIRQGTQSYLNIILYNKSIQANNHLFNSLLVKSVISIFGYNEFLIRIAGLLGGGLYIFGVYKLCQTLFGGTWMYYLGLPLLIVNPYLLDFFSIARGYSLSLGFFILSVLYIFKSYDNSINDQSLKYKIKSFCLMSLAVIANFSLLNVYFALIGTVLVMEIMAIYSSNTCQTSFKQSIDNFKNDLYYIFLITLGLAFLIFLPLLKMAQKKQFYGGKISFWHDTIASLLQSSLYGKDYFHLDFSYYFGFTLITLLALLLINFCIKFYQKISLNSTDKYLIITSSIISLTVLSIIFQNIFFGTPFVTARTALYFIPLFTLFSLLLYQSICNNPFFRLKIIPNVLFTFFGLVIMLHYLSCLNLSHTFDWPYDASTRMAMKQIFDREKENNSRQHPLAIGATWWLVPSIDFYLLQHGGHYVFIEPRGPQTLAPDASYEYYYLDAVDKKIMNKYNVTLLEHFRLSETYLASLNSIKPQCAIIK